MKLTFEIKYGKNTGLIYSAAEILNIYLYGIKINATNGTRFSEDAFTFYIREAQKQLKIGFR